MERIDGAPKRLGSIVKRAWGEFLGGFPWAHYCTLTFKIESGPDYARREFERWVRRLGFV